MDIYKHISNVRHLDQSSYQACRNRLAILAKPPGSLGKLEDYAAQIAGITGNIGQKLSKRCIVVFVSDNGIVEEGVASAPQEVTIYQARNIAGGTAGVSVLAKLAGSDLHIVNIGANQEIGMRQVVEERIRAGTRNFAKEDAMTRSECLAALSYGADCALMLAQDGYQLLGAGEMGIGNTSSSAAVFSALTGLPAAEVTGAGAGMTAEGYKHKIKIIDAAVAARAPIGGDAIDVLTKLGGYDIAAMAGLFIGVASARLPCVIDGFISAVAALCAYKLCPASRDYMIASHASAEAGYASAISSIGLTPALELSMRLGEGSGCPIMFMVLDAAQAAVREMATFGSGGISKEYTEKASELDFSPED